MSATKLSTLLDKSILQGDGSISLRGDTDLLPRLLKSNEPFSPTDIDEILILNLNASPSNDISIGDQASLALTIGAGASLEASLDIITKDDPEGAKLVADCGLGAFLDDDTMYLALRADAAAHLGGEMKARWTNLGLGGSFGVAAGGESHFLYLRPFAINGHTARDALQAFFGALKLPQNIQRVEHIPVSGEVVRLAYGGYINAGATLSWGYSMTRSTGVSLPELDLKERIFLEAQARLGAAFSLAGNFDVEVRRAREDDDNWARVTVRKSRRRSFEFAADLNVKTSVETEGLPDRPSEFLEGILGLRVTSLIDKIGTYTDRFTDADPDAFIDALKTEVDGLGRRFLDDLSTRILDKPLAAIASSEEIQTLHRSLVEIKNTHDDLGAKVVGFLEDKLDDVDLGSLIGELKEATNGLKDAAGLERITNDRVWRLLEVVVDKEWIDLIDNTDGAFDDLVKKVEALETTNLKGLETFIDAKNDALNLGSLLVDLAAIDPSKLKEDVNRHLVDLLDRLTGIGAKELKKLKLKEIRGLQKKVASLKTELETFSERLYQQFQGALDRSYELALAYRYRLATENDTLLDVEINLASDEETRNGVALPSGADLMKDAVSGDFSRVTKYAAMDRVVIRKGVLTHNVTRSHELSINLFGWNSKRTEQLITRIEDVVEQKDDGVMHIYGVEAVSESKQKRRGEETEQSLAFRILAEGFQRRGEEHGRIVNTVTAMSSSYDLRIEDRDTTENELRQYLGLAEYLRLLPAEYQSVEDFVEEIAADLGVRDGMTFGTTRLKYRLRFDEDALLNVFTSLEGSTLMSESRNTLRTISHFAFLDLDSYRGELAKAYSEPAMQATWRREGLKVDLPGTFVYKIPGNGERRDIRLTNIQRKVLNVLYKVEDSFVEELLNLDDVMDRASKGKKPSVDELAKRLTAFVGFHGELSKFVGFGERAMIPPLIAVLNRLMGLATLKSTNWRTTLEIKFELDGRTITKLLVA